MPRGHRRDELRVRRLTEGESRAQLLELLGAEEYNASPVNNPPQEVLDKCEVFKYLGDDTRIYDQIWTEIISEF